MANNIEQQRPFAFIMPHWRKNNELSKMHFDCAVKSIIEQTDENWVLIIIDDFSPDQEVRDYLNIIQRQDKRIHIIFNEKNYGAGLSRNLGIRYAAKLGASAVLFNDADDVSDSHRLEVVRNIFLEDRNASVVYSSFKVINEYGVLMNECKIAPTILEILNGHKKDIVNGYDSWIPIATKKNYTNLTSSTAVRINLALKEPFHFSRVSEDAHTWLRYGAHFGKFIYNSSIPSLYRIYENTESSSRERIKDFYEIKAKTDSDGFMRAIEIANSRYELDSTTKTDLTVKFYIKLAESILFGKQRLLSKKILSHANKISTNKTSSFIKCYGRDIQELYEEQ